MVAAGSPPYIYIYIYIYVYICILLDTPAIKLNFSATMEPAGGKGAESGPWHIRAEYPFSPRNTEHRFLLSSMHRLHFSLVFWFIPFAFFFSLATGRVGSECTKHHHEGRWLCLRKALCKLRHMSWVHSSSRWSERWCGTTETWKPPQTTSSQSS